MEGGVKVEKVKSRVEDLVQIDGMNAMGLAGVELHGVIGYNVLAKFRVEYDFTADKLAFTPLEGFDPPAPERIKAEGGDDIQSMGPLVKMLAALSGIKPNFEVVPRGFVGIEFEEANGTVVVRKVLAGSPAEKAGFKVGDAIEAVKAANVASGADLAKALAKAGVGAKLQVTVKRAGKTEERGL
jgi:serine protease DegQ